MKHTHNDCTHTHTQVARQRGKKVRRRCINCGHLGKWTSIGVTPVPSVTVNGSSRTSNSTVLEDAEWNERQEDLAMEEAVNYERDQLLGMKVADLRDMAKRHHIRGYSHMNKGDLVNALTAPLVSR